tara:strand:- start:562 stop:894 length:333 start_codon:yes stop_codon:yes gene_type:complete
MTAGSVEEEEEEASRVDLYGALNVETTATSIEVRFCFFPLYSFFCKANATCARGMHRFLRRVAVASLLCHPRRRRDDAHRERARGWKGREREREQSGEIFSFSFGRESGI